MPNLEEWIIPDSVMSFPCLNYLSIKGCPKLSRFLVPPTLRNLHICDSNATLFESITSITSLTSLGLYNFAIFDVLPVGLLQNHTPLEHLRLHRLPIKTLSNVFGNLSTLKILYLDGCFNLEFLPDGLQYLNSLKNLNIRSCDSLEPFPAAILERLSSLTSLSSEHCKKLDPLPGPLQRGTVLQRLLISDCPKFRHLPESMQQLTALTRLEIWHYEGLCSSPNCIRSLQSLSRMEIWDCNNLKSLPDGFQTLKSLRELSIAQCPLLEKRCEKPNGEDWPKISHIPNIQINWKTI